ncbi:MAG: type I-E CRISPR-associated protein Cse2/CasB, partial [Candidatus Hadarchaeum sp.]
LLNSDAEHLPGHLRQAISLLRTEGIGLDWNILLDDVCRWNAPGRPVHKQWATDYYKPSCPDGEQARLPASTSEQQLRGD